MTDTTIQNYCKYGHYEEGNPLPNGECINEHLANHYAEVEAGLSDAECCALCEPEHWEDEPLGD